MDDHNYDLASTMFTHLLPCHRKMSDGDKAQVDSFKQFGIATSKIMAYIDGQSGGYGMLRFTKRDLYNYVHGQRVFGDVLAFDFTYHSNKYKNMLVVFSGSNNHKQTSIFGFALLKDEEVRTYRWVLLNLLDVMGQKKPCVVVTDEDKAMCFAIVEGLILSRWCKDAKDWRSKPPEFIDGHQGHLLRYGALSGLMSLVVKLGAEDVAEFVVARDGIANLAETLQQRVYDRVGSQFGLSSRSALKDPLVSKTKGAPRKGKELEPEPGKQCEIPTKRRRCTSCGVPGHTKRTYTWHRNHRGAGTEGGAIPGCVECSSAVESAPSTTMRDKSAGKF
ncbi:hypothetical protein AHAS_Ahas09G0169600 [Arachis hypogaea]